jgi:uncharacterized protein YkwD
VRRKWPLAVATIFVVLVLAGSAQASALTAAEQALLQELNGARFARGLAPLQVGWRLQLAARTHSGDMLRRDYFGHGAFASRMERFGAEGPRFGENLAWGTGSQASAAAMVRMWLDSPGHREILLRPGFRRVGLAAPRGEFLGYRDARVVTVDFAGT